VTKQHSQAAETDAVVHCFRQARAARGDRHDGFVAAQREALQRAGVAELRTPVERTYIPSDPSIARSVGLD
jgi:hypothetical protein